jgi:hypothetical protein
VLHSLILEWLGSRHEERVTSPQALITGGSLRSTASHAIPILSCGNARDLIIQELALRPKTTLHTCGAVANHYTCSRLILLVVFVYPVAEKWMEHDRNEC